MASIVLGSVAAYAGNAILPGIGGVFAGTLGRSVGGLVDSKLGLGSQVKGPQLNNLSVQDSRYGAGIPVLYGGIRVAGNVIWSSDLIESSHNASIGGGKGGVIGGGTDTTYTYSVNCAVGIAQGPIGGITTIWADSFVIYQNGVWGGGLIDSASIYLGGTGQTPDPFMQSLLGSGAVPAYKGTAYIVFDNLQLAPFGNRLPNLTFEVTTAAATSDPAIAGGSLDANVSQRTQTVQGGGMPPLPLTASATRTLTALVGGYVLNGGSCALTAETYDVSGDTPVATGRAQSAGVTLTNVNDCSWAIAPDQRFVACQMTDAATLTYHLCIYDSVAASFGPVTAYALGAAAATNAIAWLDAQHFVIMAGQGTVRGVQVFARAGLGIVNLGFFAVWGNGSLTSRQPISYAQFTPFAGGLIHYVADTPGTPLFTALFACALVWRNGTLSVGTPYTVFSGISTTAGSAPHASLVQTGSGEWTFCLATTLGFHLASFIPGAASASVTRGWQDFTPAFGSAYTQFPLVFGNRIVLLQSAIGGSTYFLSDVALNASNFTVTQDSIPVSGTERSGYMCGLAIDGRRLLLMAVGGFGFDVEQVAILELNQSGQSLATIVGDILTRAGYQTGDTDVSALAGIGIAGYMLAEPMTARAALEPLQTYAPFDLVESDGGLLAVLRHAAADVAINSSEWRAVADRQEPPPPLEITRAQELDLPREVAVDFIDPARDYEVNSQRARRLAGHAQAVQKISLPIVCSAAAGKQIAETRLYGLWAERELVKLRLSRRWLGVDPGDVIDLGTGQSIRVTSIKQAGGLLDVEGFYVNASVYTSLAVADTGSGISQANTATVSSLLSLLDLPLLQGTDDQPGVYAAATGLPGWHGASLWRAADGVNYTTIAQLPQLAIAGSATTALPPGSPCYLDQVNSVTVQVVNGTLSSCALSDLYNGANPCCIGAEILQFQTATLIGPGLYALTNLLRGRRGTDALTGTHAIGEQFVLLIAGSVEFVPALLSDRGATYDFRALSRGQTLNAAQDTDFTYGLATLRPFSPVNLTGYRANGPGGDLALSWTRRARLNAEWVSYVDVPLDEPVELYDVEIMNGAVVLRTFSGVPSPGMTYTAALQSADWGGTVPAAVTVNVYQISSRYGRGNPVTATL